jgi:hypothetical protein
MTFYDIYWNMLVGKVWVPYVEIEDKLTPMMNVNVH